MSKRLLLLLAAVLMALPLGASIATADPGENNTGSEGKPCNADHGHADPGLENNERCQDGDADGGDADGGDGGNQGNDCPPASPNAGNEPNCGQGDADGGDADGGAATTNCTAASDDPGLLTDDTLGQTLWDSGFDALSPLTEDPEADGPLSGAIYDGGNGSPLEPVTDEVSCGVDFLFDGEELGFDL